MGGQISVKSHAIHFNAPGAIAWPVNMFVRLMEIIYPLGLGDMIIQYRFCKTHLKNIFLTIQQNLAQRYSEKPCHLYLQGPGFQTCWPTEALFFCTVLWCSSIPCLVFQFPPTVQNMCRLHQLAALNWCKCASISVCLSVSLALDWWPVQGVSHLLPKVNRD